MNRCRKLHRSACVANTLETAFVLCISTPSLHTCNIKLAIDRVKFTPVCTRVKFSGKRHHSALWLTIHFITKQQHVRACTKGEVNHKVFKWAPFIGINSDLPTGRVIDSTRKVDKWKVWGHFITRAARTIKAILADFANHGTWSPITFGTRHGELTIGGKADPIGVTKTGCDDLCCLTIGGNTHRTLVAGCKAEAAILFTHQTTNEIMPRRRSFISVRKAFMKIIFTIVVKVVQFGDLIPPKNIGNIIMNNHAQSVVQTRSDPAPSYNTG